jgi:hypothetical protein
LKKGYRVVRELPPGFKPDYDVFLFHHPVHLRLQSHDWVHFYLIRSSSRKAEAQVSLHLHNGVAASPVRAPFGSVLFAPHILPQVLRDFIEVVAQEAHAAGATTIRLTEPPLFYRKNSDLLHHILLTNGYRIVRSDLSAGFPVDKQKFSEKLDAWELPKWKLAVSRKLVVRPIPREDIESGYSFLSRCREERNQSLSMTWPELHKTVNAFQDALLLFGVYLNKELIAATLVIRVSDDIWYTFYTGHLKKYDALSPVVFLTGEIYRHALRHKVRLLDLGTSTVDGQTNFNLLEFKLRLGAVPSAKLTFEKELR